MHPSFEQQIINGGVVVVAMVSHRLLRLDRIHSKALHEPQDLFVDDDTTARRWNRRGFLLLLLKGHFNRHPAVSFDLRQSEPLGRIDDQHLAD